MPSIHFTGSKLVWEKAEKSIGMSEWVSEWVCVCVSAWVSKWKPCLDGSLTNLLDSNVLIRSVNEWMRMSEWVSEWVSEAVRGKVLLQYCNPQKLLK
jgi:hypothetical protein